MDHSKSSKDVKDVKVSVQKCFHKIYFTYTQMHFHEVLYRVISNFDNIYSVIAVKLDHSEAHII